MKEIPLTQGKVALVDDEDYEELSKYKWLVHKGERTGYYAKRCVYLPNGKQTLILMHRQILGLKPGDGESVDHKNHNQLDNQKNNIRICSHCQNMRNRKLRQGGTSKYKGVSKQGQKWRVGICFNYVKMYLGLFDTETQAAKIYDEAAKRYFGDFANLNFAK